MVYWKPSPWPRDGGRRALFGRRRKKSQKEEPDTRELLRGSGQAEANPLTQRFDLEEERETELFEQNPTSATSGVEPDAEKTRIFSDSPTGGPASSDRLADPPAGWLLVVEGPGTRPGAAHPGELR
jgi:hypothetical protein